MTTPTIAPDTVPRIAPLYRFQWEEAQNCHVLLYPEGMVRLSGSAGEILKRCGGEHTAAAVIEELQQTFAEPPERVATGVHRFLEVSYAKGWIRDRA